MCRVNMNSDEIDLVYPDWKCFETFFPNWQIKNKIAINFLSKSDQLAAYLV